MPAAAAAAAAVAGSSMAAAASRATAHATFTVVSAGAGLRNIDAKKRLAAALQPINLRGAPPMPVRGGAATTKQGSKTSTTSHSAAQVIHHFAMRQANPQHQSNRIARLASTVFAGEMSARSLKASPAASAATLESIGQPFRKVLFPEAESAAATPQQQPPVARQLVEYASNSLTGGFTWLAAVEPSQNASATAAIRVLNTPSYTTPLQKGWYPLLCIDVTDEAVLPSRDDEEKKSAASANAGNSNDGSKTASPPPPPAWSRAARNAAVTFTPPAAVVLPQPAEVVPPSELRARRATAAVAHVDWTFVESQYAKAQAWYTSDARKDVRAASAAALKAKLEAQLPKRVTRTIDDADSDGIVAGDEAALIAAAPPDAAAEVEASPAAAPVDLSGAGDDVAAAAAADDIAAATVPAPSDGVEADGATVASATQDPLVSQALNLTLRDMPQGEGTQLGDGSLMFTLEDGSVEYVRQDGTRAVVRGDGTQEEYSNAGRLEVLTRPDGVQVWPNHQPDSEHLHTAVFPNGDTMYVYRNGLTLTKCADGSEVTRYADGTTARTEPGAPAS